MGLGKTLRGTRGFCSRGSLDALGTPLGFAYYQENGTPVYYFYETNLQGDVVAIYDANGSKVVSFTYDAWGNFTATVVNTTVCTNFFIEATLFRYRGYIYDYESGLYYLQSRYYDPETGRFLNADGYVNANGDLVGYNMYAYCSNNPVMYTDPSGTSVLAIWAIIGICGVIGAVIGGVLSYNSGDDGLEVLKTTALGFLTGAVIAGATITVVATFTTIALGSFTAPFIFGAQINQAWAAGTLVLHGFYIIAGAFYGSDVEAPEYPQKYNIPI